MAFTGNEKHSISLEDASKLTENYRKTAGTGAVLGGYFSKTVLNKMLTQEGCIGIRYYYGRTDGDKPTLVLVGVDSDGNDITGGDLAEYSVDCPPYCPKENELNS